MADKTISDFTAQTTLDDADIFEIESAAGNSRKITAANVRKGLGVWTVIDSAEASASASLELLLSATAFDQFKLELHDIVMATTTADLEMEVGTGAGPTYDTGNNYDTRMRWHYGTSAGGTTDSASQSGIGNLRLGTIPGASNPNNKPVSGTCRLKGLISGRNAEVVQGRSDYDGSGGLTTVMFSGVHNATGEITALKILASAGNITSGKVVLYGRNLP